MRRIHLFELHDMEWMPAACRGGLTDLMALFAVAFDIYGPLMPRLEGILRECGSSQIVDLCSGGTGPVSTLVDRIRTEDGGPIRVVLTDLFPNLPAFARAQGRHPGKVEYREDPVDAAKVPPDLKGFRTLFASLHHFRPAQAVQILRDAAEQGRGIAAFEFTERNFLIWGIPILLIPAFFWVLMPFVRPLRGWTLFWTYAVPLVPLMGAWDAFVSCMRTYTPAELEEMTAAVPVPGYRWETGRARTLGAMRVTYLFGYPSKPQTVKSLG